MTERERISFFEAWRCSGGFGSFDHIGVTVCHTRMSREIAKRVLELADETCERFLRLTTAKTNSSKRTQLCILIGLVF
jgi:hypothetical protein